MIDLTHAAYEIGSTQYSLLRSLWVSWPTTFLVATLAACAQARDAQAELGPCTTAAPTTPESFLLSEDRIGTAKSMNMRTLRGR
jgi:hypothetical protein